MSLQTLNNPATRINKYKGEILAHAIPVEVLGLVGEQIKMPKNVSANIVFRSWIPYGATLTNSSTYNRWTVDANAHLLQEGVTPQADSLTPRDVTATLQEYGVLYGLTNRTEDLNEDDVPMAMKQQAGERIGLLREMIRYGELKAGTNSYYGGGTTRATVASKITIGLLRKISRNLQANHASRITSVLAMSYDFGSSPVEASYIVFAHTDLEADIRDLPNFVEMARYAQRKPFSPYELGSCENFRFVLSPELGSYADAGAAIGSTGLYSTTGSNIDVYPFIVAGENAWGQVSLRGDDAISPTYLPAGQKTKDDPHGQRGYIGASFYMTAKRTNDGFMAVGEVGITVLS